MHPLQTMIRCVSWKTPQNTITICPNVRLVLILCTSQNVFMYLPIYLQHAISTQKAQKEVFITLKAIESLSYDCLDSDKLQMLHQMLKNVENRFRSLLPHQDGLLLRPTLVTHLARKVSLKYRKLRLRSSKYGCLPLHKRTRKGTIGKWRYWNRVGKKADEHKKV